MYIGTVHSYIFVNVLLYYIQERLRDVVGWVPDYHNKEYVTVKRVTQIFLHKSYIYILLQSIKRATALFLEKQCTYLNLKYFIAKNF